MSTAILIDADFFLRNCKRYNDLDKTPQGIATALHDMCIRHVSDYTNRRELYRIFVYDCPPLNKKVHNPISKKCIDYSKSDLANFRNSFHEELKKKRKVALRLGHLSDNSKWIIKQNPMKKLLKGDISISNLEDSDVSYTVNQKGVDMKIGLDIASLAYKKIVDQIILVSGDSDFVPAAKLARIEGIDFILDPMWAPIRPELHEHIDGLKTVVRKECFYMKNKKYIRQPDLVI